MSRRSRRTQIDRAVQAALVKAAPDFQQAMLGGSGTVASAALMARLNRGFGVTGAQAAQFGPSSPAQPQPLDTTGEPRSWQYRTGWNITSLPGEGRPLDLGTLRQLANTYDILRKAIEIRKDEICSLRFDITARDTDRRRAREVIVGQQDTIARVRAFFMRPDGRHSFQNWLRQLLEEYFVTDAVAIWKWRTLGGELKGLRLIDGALIKPLLDVQGEQPLPPLPAFQQYVYGVARQNFVAVGADENGNIHFTQDELIYAPKNVAVSSVYGFSPVEQFLCHINTALRYGTFVADYFTDGTIPEGVATAPAGWSAQQIAEYNVYWDSLIAGDSRALRKLKFVPAGFEWKQFKPFTFDAVFARWLVNVTCAALDVTPQELGFEPEHGGLGGKGFSDEQTAILKRKAIGPLVRWLCDEIINPIIWTEFDAPELQAVFQDADEEDEALQTSQATDLDIRNGRRSIDQVVEEMGGTPPGIGRILVVGNTVYGEPDLITLTKEGAAALAGQSAKATAAALPKPAAPEPVPGETVGERQGKHGALGSAPAAKTEGKESTSTSKSALTEEVARFLRFASERQTIGKWRDFRSDVIPPPTLTDLNKAAQSGAGSDELRALVGLHDLPGPFKARLASTERAYRGLTQKLAARVAEEVEAHA